MVGFKKAVKPLTTTIVFLDWDDKEIGRLNVPQGVDVRAAVNDYVKNNLVHPELRESTNHASLERKDTYRGIYPSEPGGDHTVGDGDQYPVTAKLDYSFVKGPCHYEGDKLIIEDTTPDDPYPFTHGWAVVDDLQNPPWTTVGVGELKEFEHRKTGGGV